MKKIKLKDYSQLAKYSIENSSGISIRFYENGQLSGIEWNNILISQGIGSPLENGPGNIYLKMMDSQGNGLPAHFSINNPEYVKLISHSDRWFKWTGQAGTLEYSCSMTLHANENLWFWNIDLRNNGLENAGFKVVYAQDVGIAARGAVLTNEAYTSQYIDHAVLQSEKFGPVICSRQNQSQPDGRGGWIFPWMINGCLTGAENYLTDGFDFYGLGYKETNIPEALKTRSMQSVKLQYEFAMAALETGEIRLVPGECTKVRFFAWFIPDHASATSGSDIAYAERAELLSAGDEKESLPPTSVLSRKGCLFDNVKMFRSDDLSDAGTAELFGENLLHREESGGRLLSFFKEDGAHVVLKRKEMLCQRPHGHIMRSGRNLDVEDNVLSTTAWMYGVFNSQLTIGNTSFSKVLSVSRSHLNCLKSSGQRIFIMINGSWELLGIPSAFEMGFNYAKWFYKHGEKGLIEVTVWTSMKHSACYLNVRTRGGEIVELIITNALIAGVNEFEGSPEITFDPKSGTVSICPDPKSMILSAYPETSYYIVPVSREKILSAGTAEILFDDEKQGTGLPWIVFRTRPVDDFTMIMTGNVLSADECRNSINEMIGAGNCFESDKKSAMDFLHLYSNGAAISCLGAGGAGKLDSIFNWYLHNALVHYSIPHGLEQYIGAAWGVRDVTQGPVELFLAMRKYTVVKEILKIVFSHQYADRGDWPQWFMFDRFTNIQQKESHGDVIVWPLKALCDYISASDDFSILDENIPYTDDSSLVMTSGKTDIYGHVAKLVEKIEKDFIRGTSLSCYGDGDWDDTLQPAEEKMRERMVSGWTVQLTYQAVSKASIIFAKAGKIAFSNKLSAIADGIRRDYNTYVIRDGVAAGFVCFNEDGTSEALLHPSDKKTGIIYRLLPMTRGIISELFTKTQAYRHYEIIRKELLFPDGVHLMNTPAKYLGGPNRFFKRAEQASNFGREIGLQYVHAHIRYIEALCKLGFADEAYKAFLIVNPILIMNQVGNAATRQSNTYFSSSDGCFNDRYAAETNFTKLKTGEVRVKGGWRVYSSGPGIYLNQLVSNFLGLREEFGNLVFDPVLPKKLNGLVFDFKYGEFNVSYRYLIREKCHTPQRIIINGKPVTGFALTMNPYREGGAVISRKVFEKHLVPSIINQIEIHL